jgi:hypothetical protein
MPKTDVWECKGIVGDATGTLYILGQEDQVLAPFRNDDQVFFSTLEAVLEIVAISGNVTPHHSITREKLTTFNKWLTAWAQKTVIELTGEENPDIDFTDFEAPETEGFLNDQYAKSPQKGYETEYGWYTSGDYMQFLLWFFTERLSEYIKEGGSRVFKA